MQRAVTPPSYMDTWGFDSLPTHCGCGRYETRRKFQWRNTRLQIGKRQVRSLPGVLMKLVSRDAQRSVSNGAALAR